MVRITRWHILTTRWKSLSLHQNFPFPRSERRFSSYPSNPIWRTLAYFTFHSWSVETNSTHFSVRLWTVTQFNAPKNEMSLKVLLVIWNWKYPRQNNEFEFQRMKVFLGLQLERVLITLLSKIVCGLALGFS